MPLKFPLELSSNAIMTPLGTVPAWMSALLFIVVVLPIAKFMTRRKPLNLPVIDLSKYKDSQAAMLDGYSKYPNTPFFMPFEPPIAILPISTLEEVRNLPERQTSFNQVIKQIFLYKHTGIGAGDPLVLRTIKGDLTRNIASTLDALQDEIRYAFKELGPCEDWTKITLYPFITRIIALLSSRVFIGLPTSRDAEWVDATINYAMDCEGARRAILQYPTWLHGIVSPFLPAIRRLKQNKKRGGKILEPILKTCLAELGNEKASKDSSSDRQGTFFSWILNQLDDPSAAKPAEMYHLQMSLAFGAIHTTSQATFHTILDLAARPQYVQPLLDEIQNVLAEDGHDEDNDGLHKIKKSSIPKLKKLDSFMKESQRLSPPALLVTMVRETTAPLALSTGHTLPTGTRIAFPAFPVHTSTSTPTFAPSNNPPSTLPPDQFDGFRFANLRAVAGQESKHQFVTTSADSLNFGHGNHACPGRFFAGNEMKVVLVELLRSWEVRLTGDVAGKGGDRPRNLEGSGVVFPDMGVEIEVRRRR